MGFLQEPPQHFLGSYMGFLSNFFKARTCKDCHHCPTQKIPILFSLMQCTLIVFFFPAGRWPSWHCGGISVCSLLPFYLRGWHKRGGSISRAPQCDQAQGWRFEHQPVCTLRCWQCEGCSAEGALQWPCFWLRVSLLDHRTGSHL